VKANSGGEMRKLPGGLALTAAIAMTLLAAPAGAQTAAATKKISSDGAYDVRNERTLTGRVTSVVAHPRPGMLGGVHLLIATPSGTVDAHLGPFALMGSNPVTVSAGDSVKVVGVMTTVRSNPVFITRTVTVGSKTYIIRNEKGFPSLPAAAPPSSLVSKGGQQ
jgi:hypothetical protein